MSASAACCFSSCWSVWTSSISAACGTDVSADGCSMSAAFVAAVETSMAEVAAAASGFMSSIASKIPLRLLLCAPF